MPSIAQKLLLSKLESSGNWELARHSFREATGKTLALWAEDAEAERHPKAVASQNAGRVEVDLEVASVHLGSLFIREELEPQKRDAFRHLLEMIAQSLSDRLLRETRDQHPALPDKVIRAVRLLQQTYQEPVTLKHVAKQVNLSEERLSRLFHESLGVTFSEYLNRLRLDQCRKALEETDESITEIAFKAGFQSISQFNRRFRSAEGMNPRSYRSAYRKPGKIFPKP